MGVHMAREPHYIREVAVGCSAFLTSGSESGADMCLLIPSQPASFDETDTANVSEDEADSYASIAGN